MTITRLIKEEGQYYDYCLYPYKPLNDNIWNISSYDLFCNISSVFSYNKKLNELICHLRESFWINKTVWGIKQNSDRLEIEFYFYLYNLEKESFLVINEMLLKINEIIDVDFELKSNIECFMFSIDINENVLNNKRIDWIHLYMETWWSYYYWWSEMIYENNYFFYNPKKDLKSAANKLKELNSLELVKDIFNNDYINCARLCICKKQKAIWIYYSRVKFDSFYEFIANNFNDSFILWFIANNNDKLRHLYYDISINYGKDSNNWNRVSKTWFYWFF